MPRNRREAGWWVERFVDELARLYQRDVVAADKQPQFFILLAFLTTFVIVRLITHAIRRKQDKPGAKPGGLLHNLSFGGTHVHHLVWGILLLLVTGYLAIGLRMGQGREVLAVLYGVGAALTLDEFALWLHLEDVYWAKQGRDSIDVVVVAAVVLALFVVGQTFWLDVADLIGRLVGLS